MTAPAREQSEGLQWRSIFDQFLLGVMRVRRLSRIASSTAVLLAVAWWAPVSAQNMDVMKILGKAQSESERRAVEELINKLQSRGRQSEPPPATAAEPVSTPLEAPSLQAGSPPASQQTSATPSIAPPPIAAPEPVQDAARTANPVLPAAAPAVTVPAAAETGAARKPATLQPAAASGPPAESEMPASAGNDGAAKAIGTAVLQAPAIAAREGLPTVDLEIYFEFASARLSPRAMATLGALGLTLSDPRLADQTFVIAGYTDRKGKPDFNIRLSQMRADTVRQFLINKFNIDGNRLIAKGYGKTQFKNASNPLADENRRVQVINWTSQLGH
jgi:outer membrane protein OmpA-like peptidoglycan-associated protein